MGDRIGSARDGPKVHLGRFTTVRRPPRARRPAAPASTAARRRPCGSRRRSCGWSSPSAISRTTTPGGPPHITRSGSSVTASPWATSTRLITASFVWCRMSGSNPPSSRQARIGHLLPRRAGVAGRPVRGRQVGERHGAAVPPPRDGPRAGRAHRLAAQVDALDARRARVRPPVPFVGQHQVDVAQRQRRQRLLGLGLDQLAAQPGRVVASACIAGVASRSATDWNAATRALPVTPPAAAASSASAARRAPGAPPRARPAPARGRSAGRRGRPARAAARRPRPPAPPAAGRRRTA